MAKDESIEKKEERNNRILIIGVSFFSFLFFILWLFNIQGTIFSSLNEQGQEVDSQYWRNLQEEFTTSFTEMNLVWQEARLSQVVTEGELFIEEFKNKLEAEENKEELEDSLPESLLIEEEPVEGEEQEGISYCPEFVNCLPTYNGPEELCQVPPGCEGITLKVY